MKKTLLVCAAVLGGLLASDTRARAELMIWSEHWVAKPPIVKASGPKNGGVAIDTNPLSFHGLGTFKQTVATLFSFSNDHTSTPQTFKDAPITLTLKIHELSVDPKLKSVQSAFGTLTFTGELNGTLNAKTSDLTLTLNSTYQRLHLGSYWYDVTLKNLVPGGVRDTGYLGKLVATINVHHNPEPSSLVLAALGAPLFILPAWRRRRQKKGAIEE